MRTFLKVATAIVADVALFSIVYMKTHENTFKKQTPKGIMAAKLVQGDSEYDGLDGLDG